MKIYWTGKLKNIIGPKLKQLRTEMGHSQYKSTSRLQLHGIECIALTVLRIEKGERFVPDYKVIAVVKFFDLRINEPLKIDNTDSP